MHWFLKKTVGDMTHKRWDPRLKLRQSVYLFLYVNSMSTSSIHVDLFSWNISGVTIHCMPDNKLISNTLQNRCWHRRVLCMSAKHSNNHKYSQCFVARYRTTACKQMMNLLSDQASDIVKRLYTAGNIG